MPAGVIDIIELVEVDKKQRAAGFVGGYVVDFLLQFRNIVTRLTVDFLTGKDVFLCRLLLRTVIDRESLCPIGVLPLRVYLPSESGN